MKIIERRGNYVLIEDEGWHHVGEQATLAELPSDQVDPQRCLFLVEHLPGLEVALAVLHAVSEAWQAGHDSCINDLLTQAQKFLLTPSAPKDKQHDLLSERLERLRP